MAPGTEPTVRDIMRNMVPVASLSTPIAELARLMVEHRVPGLRDAGHETAEILIERDGRWLFDSSGSSLRLTSSSARPQSICRRSSRFSMQ